MILYTKAYSVPNDYMKEEEKKSSSLAKYGKTKKFEALLFFKSSFNDETNYK